MAPDKPANNDAPRLDAEQVFMLARAHLSRPLALTEDLLLPPHVARVTQASDPHWVVGELLRLALIGAIAEGEHPEAPVHLVLGFAHHMLERS